MFDETPRLFSVADILQKRKNKDDDYEFEDFPDTREQYATGKYDSNFDALGSEFERAHSYDLNNVKQPENTESDIDFSDYYDRLLKYEPSSYIKLEEDEIIPFSIDNDKPNEYYIDNLKDKTLDDLMISKMKEDAGAQDLPRDAMRRKFAEDMIRNKEVEITARVHLDAGITDHNLAPVLQELKKNNNKKVRAAGIDNVIIEPPLSSSVKSARVQGIRAPVLGSTPEKVKSRGRHAVKNKSSSSSTQGAVAFVGELNPKTNRISTDSLRPQHVDENEQQAILNDIKHNKKNNNKNTKDISTILNTGKQLSSDYIDSLDGISGGGAVAKYKKPTQSAESAKTIDDQEPTLGELEKKLANLRTESARRKELGSLKDRVEKLNDSDKLNDEDWVDYQALVRYYGLKTGNRPKAFTALTRLIKLTKNFDAMEDNKTFMENDDIQDEEIEALRQRYIKNTSDDSPLNVRTVKPMKRIAQKDEAGQVITNSPTKLRLAVKNTITQKDYPVTENRI